MRDCQSSELLVQFDRRLKLKFLGSQITNDAVLLGSVVNSTQRWGLRRCPTTRLTQGEWSVAKFMARLSLDRLQAQSIWEMSVHD